MTVISLILVILVLLGLIALVSRIGPTRPRGFTCRVCGKTMERTWISWKYPLPFEIWAVVAHYQLDTAILFRFVCPNRHTQAWFIPRFGDRQCEVVVTKTLHKD